MQAQQQQQQQQQLPEGGAVGRQQQQQPPQQQPEGGAASQQPPQPQQPSASAGPTLEQRAAARRRCFVAICSDPEADAEPSIPDSLGLLDTILPLSNSPMMGTGDNLLPRYNCDPGVMADLVQGDPRLARLDQLLAHAEADPHVDEADWETLQVNFYWSDFMGQEVHSHGVMCSSYAVAGGAGSSGARVDCTTRRYILELGWRWGRWYFTTVTTLGEEGYQLTEKIDMPHGWLWIMTQTGRGEHDSDGVSIGHGVEEGAFCPVLTFMVNVAVNASSEEEALSRLVSALGVHVEEEEE